MLSSSLLASLNSLSFSLPLPQAPGVPFVPPSRVHTIDLLEAHVTFFVKKNAAGSKKETTMARTNSERRARRRRGGASAAATTAATLALVALVAAASPFLASAGSELQGVSRGDGSQEPTRATLGAIPGVAGASAALHGETGYSSSSSAASASASSTSTTNSTTQKKKSSFSSYPFPASLRLGHWDPPTSGCAAALLNNPNYTQVAQPDGSVRFFLPWETWPCMNGAQVRTFLTAKKVAVANATRADDDCKALDAGFEISTWAFNASSLPDAAQANACRPPFCAHFGGKVNGTLCQQPYLREYFNMPAADTHFQPFKVAQLDWEPEGHAPMGVYSDPHLDLHLYYTDQAAVEAIGVGGCNRWGFLSQDAWFRSLKPVPIQCFPTGAYTNTALAVSGMVSWLRFGRGGGEKEGNVLTFLFRDVAHTLLDLF